MLVVSGLIIGLAEDFFDQPGTWRIWIMQLWEKPTRVMLEDILLVTGAPPWEDAALPYATEIATQHNARLQVVHLVSPELQRKVAELRAKHGYARAAEKPDIRPLTRTLVDRAHLEEHLRQITDSRDFDLVIASSRKTTPGGRPELGDAVEQALRVGKVPVLVMGPSVSEEQPRTVLGTVVYATDFSPQANAAAQHALSWAQEHEAWLTMLHAIEGIHPAHTEHEQGMLKIPFRRRMQALVPGDGPLWCEVEQRVEFGNAAEAIVATAKDLYADLVVMGLPGLDGQKGRVVGTTAREVMLSAPCPVLLVRHYMRKQYAPSAAAGRRRLGAPVAA